MSTEADEALSGIEEKMLDLIDREYERLNNQDEAPVPMTLVALLDKSHKAILGRLSKRGGFDMASMMKNPESALLMLDRTKNMLLRMMEQRKQAQA